VQDLPGLLNQPPPAWLIKGFLPADGLVLLAGPPGAGKSFIVVDAMLCVSHGLPWCGMKVRPGPVIYICAEGGGGVPQRLRAWYQFHGRPITSGRVHVINRPLQLGSEDADDLVTFVQLLGDLGGIAPALIIVDPRSVLGG